MADHKRKRRDDGADERETGRHTTGMCSAAEVFARCNSKKKSLGLAREEEAAFIIFFLTLADSSNGIMPTQEAPGEIGGLVEDVARIVRVDKERAKYLICNATAYFKHIASSPKDVEFHPTSHPLCMTNTIDHQIKLCCHTHAYEVLTSTISMIEDILRGSAGATKIRQAMELILTHFQHQDWTNEITFVRSSIDLILEDADYPHYHIETTARSVAPLIWRYLHGVGAGQDLDVIKRNAAGVVHHTGYGAGYYTYNFLGKDADICSFNDLREYMNDVVAYAEKYQHLNIKGE